MKIIKFRAYKEKDSLGSFGYVSGMYGNHILQGDRNYWLNDEYIGRDFILMQFTGLLDKNGKEIYEGDVIKVLDRDWSDMEKDTKHLIVYYAKDSFILINKTGVKERESDNSNHYNKDWYETKLYKEYGRDRFEIIGNIYENPELLPN